MRHIDNSVCAILMAVGFAAAAFAQPAAKTATAVPRLVQFGGTLTDAGGKPPSGVVGVTFSLYEEQEGGAPVWMETQNVQAGANGEYTALLGSTRNEGLPAEIFGAGQRWLGVQTQGQAERTRVRMTSVPYSLKSVDSETLGGLPASAFALAGTTQGTGNGGTASAASGLSSRAVEASGSAKPATTPAAVTGSGTAGAIPLWTGSTVLGNSAIFQSGSAVGIGALTTGYLFSVSNTSGSAITGGTSSPSAFGVTGDSSAASGTGWGVGGFASSATGYGVYGENTAKTGLAIGVQGYTGSPTGVAVHGTSTSETGVNFGVDGVADSTSGIGVQGHALAASGSTIGVSGISDSDTGIGVQGVATAESGGANGVYGTAAGSGNGVEGYASDASGTGNGVFGTVPSPEAFGVYGQNTAATGSAFGVNGTSESTTGVGTHGQALAVTGINFGVDGVSSSTSGIGVQGHANAVSGSTTGVSGIADSTAGTGVAGQATAASGTTYGVKGMATSPDGFGVLGVAIAASTLGKDFAGDTPSGVWGDTKDGEAGVLATNDDGYAIQGYNNSPSSATLFVENQEDDQNTAIVLATDSDFGGHCDIFVSGDLDCNGSIGGDVMVGPGASRAVSMYAMQAAENWFEDAGSGQLRNGAAVVALDAEFAQTVNSTMEYHVFLTPKGDCKGLYVANETAGSFEVHELGGGSSSIAFDYRIMVKRKGYENIRMAASAHKNQRVRNSRSGNGVRAARATAPANVWPPPAETAQAAAARPERAAKLPAHTVPRPGLAARPPAHVAKPVPGGVTPQP